MEVEKKKRKRIKGKKIGTSGPVPVVVPPTEASPLPPNGNKVNFFKV